MIMLYDLHKLKNDMLKGIEGNVSLLSSFIVINFIKVIKLIFNK